MEDKEFYKLFGPKLGTALHDSFALYMLDEINILREKVGLPVRSGQEIIDAITNKRLSILNKEI